MTEQRTWIQSAGYDLPLIVLAPVLGLVFAAAAAIVGERTLLNLFVVESTFLILGMPHYLSSWVFYLDDENARYYAQRRWAFYGGPVVVVILLTLSLYLHLFLLLAAVVAIWNVFHVARQSCGILSIYRHKGGGNNAAEKWPANAAVIGSSAALFFFGAGQDPNIAARFGARDALTLAAAACAVVAAIGLVVLAARMRRRPVAASELIFLLSSIGLFVPYALMQDVMLATTAMLSGHYVQYLAIVWLLNARKHAHRTGSLRQRALTLVSRSVTAILTFILAMAAASVLFDRALHLYGLNAMHAWWLNAVVLLHFYLDGLIWAFRDPHVRQSLGPYLVGPREAVPSLTPAAVAPAT